MRPSPRDSDIRAQGGLPLARPPPVVVLVASVVVAIAAVVAIWFGR
jgi:hypothetical protein